MNRKRIASCGSLPQNLAVLLSAAALVAATVPTRVARANILMDVQYASGGAAGSTPYLALVDSNHELITLKVYCLITDSEPDSSVDGFENSIGGFYVASSALKGDVSFGSWNSGNVLTDRGFGVQYRSTYGALGLGGSVSSDTALFHWYSVEASTPAGVYPTGGGLYTPPSASSPVGVEYLLGTVDVNFSAYTLPTSLTTASIASVANNHIGITMGNYSFQDSAGRHFGLKGDNALVGDGDGNLLYSTLGAGLVFEYPANAVPEPSTLTLLAAVAVALGVFVRSRCGIARSEMSTS